MGVYLDQTYGLITLLGSGETSLAGGRVFETIASQLPRSLRIAVLETPAGFELNSAQVAGRVAEFLDSRLKNFAPIVDTVPARKRGTAFSPDEEAVLAPLVSATLIFMGPGSPTYAVRQLTGSLAWELVRARHRMGAALAFASAATIAIGRWCLPVYEIYKVGEDVKAVEGLDLFAEFGLPLSFIPHWNNSDGGNEVDTSRCFIGRQRFELWRDQLPPENIVIGLDEHTGLTFDLLAKKCHVLGVGSVTLLRGPETETYRAETEFPFSQLGNFHLPETPLRGISKIAMDLVNSPSLNTGEEPPVEVLRLLAARQEARNLKDWATSDQVREQIAAMGWQVQDTPTEPELVRINKIKRN